MCKMDVLHLIAKMQIADHAWFYVCELRDRDE